MFDELIPGAVYGEACFVLSREAVAQWSELFPDDAAAIPTMPPAMIAMVTMRAFMQVMRDRPRGNVHAGQNFRIMKLPILGSRLVTQIECVDKALKHERRWVTFRTETKDQADDLVFCGEMRMLWAA